MIRSNLYVKRRLVSLEIDIFSFVIDSVKKMPNNRAKEMIDLTKLIRSKSRALKLEPDVVKELEMDFSNLYLRVRGKVRGEAKDDERIYGAIRAMIEDKYIDRVTNRIVWRQEFEAKHNAIYGIDGLLAKTHGPFYVSSSHPHPACGHEAYEGKLYYDRDREKKNSYTTKDKKLIRAIIAKRCLMSLQEVMGDPIYLYTRRNCRHYFKEVSVKDIISGTVSVPRSAPASGSASRSELEKRNRALKLRLLGSLEKKLPRSQVLKADVKKVRS